MAARRIPAVVALIAVLSLAAARAQKEAETSFATVNLLILPFENLGKDARLDWIGEGLAELSAERISGDGRLVFPREEWLAALERMGLPASGHFSRATMIKVGEEVGADYVVFGLFTSDGKTLTATAHVLQLDPPNLSAPLVESGPLADLAEIQGRLAWRVLNAVDSAVPVSRQAFLETAAVPRLDAFEHYIRGLLAAEEPQRLRLLREAARLAPGWAPPAFALGQAYFEHRDYATAAGWFSRIPATDKRGPEAAFYAGVCYLMRNDATRAETSLRAAVERVAFPEGRNNLGAALARQDAWRDAAAQWQQAQKMDPEEPDYWFNFGLASLQMNEPVAAVRPFREALKRRPDDREARTLLIAALERSGRTTEATAEREASSLAPPSVLPAPRLKPKFAAPLWANRARRNGNSGRRAAHAKLHSSRGDELLKAGKVEEAQREFTEALLIEPQSADAHLGLAEAYHRQGRVEDAIRELRAALWSNEDVRARLALARLLLEQNRSGDARAELRAALKADPDNREARNLLDGIERSSATGARQ